MLAVMDGKSEIVEITIGAVQSRTWWKGPSKFDVYDFFSPPSSPNKQQKLKNVFAEWIG